MAGLLAACLAASAIQVAPQERARLSPGSDQAMWQASIDPSKVSDEDLESWVEDRIEELQPTELERRLDRIGWARDIRHALRLAREHSRPVFLFTHKGRINTGRC